VMNVMPRKIGGSETELKTFYGVRDTCLTFIARFAQWRHDGKNGKCSFAVLLLYHATITVLT
jgi:hypothetical protein